MGIDISIQRSGKDPILECDFLVEIEGVAVAGYMEFTEPTYTMGSSKYREGNMANVPHKQRGLGDVSNVTLKRGVFANDDVLWDWFVAGTRKTVDIVALKHGRDGDRRARVTRLYEVQPIMWKDPKGDAMSEDAPMVHDLEMHVEDFDVNP